MLLVSWCPRCSAPVSGGGEVEDVEQQYLCDTHGPVPPLWQAPEVDYGTFSDVLALAVPLPTWVPWPLSPGWTIADVAVVTDPEDSGLATMTTTVGTSSLDGEVSVTIVTEEPGIGLGARMAGLTEPDPGPLIGQGPPSVKVRLDQHAVSLWAVASGDEDDVLARAVFAGEAGGRWLWLVMRPASAALLLRDEWLFADAGEFGPEAVEIPFGGRRPPL